MIPDQDSRYDQDNKNDNPDSINDFFTDEQENKTQTTTTDNFLYTMDYQLRVYV